MSHTDTGLRLSSIDLNAVAHGRIALCALSLICCAPSMPTVVHARQTSTAPASATASTLTPLQNEIEKQRARLASANVEDRRDAVMRLGAMARPDSSRAATPALKDSAAIVRATAARAVLSLPANEAAVRLLPLLADRDEFVRREAAYASGETRSQTAVNTLVAILARDKSAGVRGAAAVALGEIGDRAAVPALSAALGRRVSGSGLFSRVTFAKTDENEFVRRAAAAALGEIGDRAAVPALIAALSNERADDDVRREAARALGLIADPSAIDALRAALTARDPYLSRLAFEALRKLDPAGAARPM